MNKQELLEQLATSAIALLSTHNVSQSEMYAYIKDALQKHVNNKPVVKVLYNNCYGGYTLSKPFKVFLHDKQTFTTMKEERTSVIQYIRPFAVSLLDSGMYKGLREILYLYHYHDFGNIMSLVRKVIQLEKDKLNVLLNIEMIRIYLEDPTSKFEEDPEDTWYTATALDTTHLSLWRLKIVFNDNQFEKYTRQQLQNLLSLYEKSDFLKDMSDTLTQTSKKLTTLLGQEIYDKIDRFIELEQKSECEAIKYTLSNRWGINETNNFNPFITLIQTNGYTNELVWRNQKSYDKYAMKFLIMTYASQQSYTHKHDTIYDFVFNKHIPSEQEVMDKLEETFGLLCASGPFSQLAIATVPPLLEWNVGDYDGLENVYVV